MYQPTLGEAIILLMPRRMDLVLGFFGMGTRRVPSSTRYDYKRSDP
jgi:hypothetical protein